MMLKVESGRVFLGAQLYVYGESLWCFDGWASVRIRQRGNERERKGNKAP